jgi:8-oxo-dGTP pyrophosphatase MutT (NUDIX family)
VIRGVVHRGLLRVFRRLPTRARLQVVRTIAPQYTVGAICVIERRDGAILLVQHSYRRRWGTPGGLLKRGEPAATAALREVTEEVGLTVELVGEPAVVVDAESRRVDVVFRARWHHGAGAEEIVLGSPEVIDAQWFEPDGLPELQHETASALIALARATSSPLSPLLLRGVPRAALREVPR